MVLSEIFQIQKCWISELIQEPLYLFNATFLVKLSEMEGWMAYSFKSFTDRFSMW